MAAKIITVFNEKGGAGKSTISIHIAGTLGLRGFRVKIHDIDPQNTSVKWVARAPDNKPFPARIANLSALGKALHREIMEDARSFDYIVVDCPPSSESPAANSALIVSDLAVIPVLPSPTDVWEVGTAKRLVRAAAAVNPDLRGVVVLNMVRRNTLAKVVRAELAKDTEIPLLKAQLSLLNAFNECPLVGGTVHSVPRAKAAIAEVDALLDEITARLADRNWPETSKHETEAEA